MVSQNAAFVKVDERSFEIQETDSSAWLEYMMQKRLHVSQETPAKGLPVGHGRAWFGTMVPLGLLALVGLNSCLTAKELPFLNSTLSEFNEPQAAAQKASGGQNSQPTGQAIPSGALPVAGVPQVSYEDGELTIVAENALLSDVLMALQKSMGAEIDLPPGMSAQRVWVRLGPGPAREVVGELLSGTEMNYVIQGSATDADGIRMISLMPHAKSAPGSAPEAERTQTARMGSRGSTREEIGTADASEQESAAQAASTTTTDTAQPDTTPAAPTAPTAVAKFQTPQATSGIAGEMPSGGRTAEQMAQQLQSMYQQRRQMQINQQNPNPSSTTNP